MLIPPNLFIPNYTYIFQYNVKIPAKVWRWATESLLFLGVGKLKFSIAIKQREKGWGPQPTTTLAYVGWVILFFQYANLIFQLVKPLKAVIQSE
jgi:hypothetical protein